MLPTVVDTYLSRSVVVHNMDSETTHKDIRQFFSPDLIMTIVRIPDTLHDSKQVALVVFEHEDAAKRAIQDRTATMLGSSRVVIQKHEQ
jgi:hypothetical protein